MCAKPLTVCFPFFALEHVRHRIFHFHWLCFGSFLIFFCLVTIFLFCFDFLRNTYRRLFLSALPSMRGWSCWGRFMHWRQSSSLMNRLPSSRAISSTKRQFNLLAHAFLTGSLWGGPKFWGGGRAGMTTVCSLTTISWLVSKPNCSRMAFTHFCSVCRFFRTGGPTRSLRPSMT